MMLNQSFHLVQLSPWPLTGSVGAMIIMYSLLAWFHLGVSITFPIAALIIASTMLMWWRDVTREATLSGAHTLKVQRGLEWGMILFITSEIMFFSAFFWAFFHSSLAPTMDLGASWPPAGVWPLNPLSVPLLNTAVLLASGVTVTWAHHGLLSGLTCELEAGLTLTVLLGIYFTYLQATEYLDTSFGFNDSVYGSSFFIATGFHGLHVLIGSTFLLACLLRAHKTHLSEDHHFGLEAAAWYWHFVDVVWIFLFLSMYWWGSS